MKESASAPGGASLPIGEPAVASLRPVATERGAIEAEDVRALTKWRNRHVHSFLTEFAASEDRTEHWLADSVGPDDTRILFMVDDADGRTVGHIGLAYIDWQAGTAEVDAVVRGVEGQSGLMGGALRTLWRWGRDELGLSGLAVRVRSDNPAVGFYEHLGFREVRRVPLRRMPTGDGAEWLEDPGAAAPDVALIHMELENGD